jgi:SAM-dependent methyltransferase
MNTQSFWDQKKQGLTELTWGPLKFAQILAPIVKNKRVLDIGCGGGALTAFLAINGARVTGIDFSQEMIRCAKERFAKINFIQGDILTTVFDEPFDIICGIAVLHEIDALDTDKLLRFFINNLKVTGFGFFLENNFFNPLFKLVRTCLVGRYGIPKMGSDNEIPFDNNRFIKYRKAFKYCEKRCDIFLLFELINLYLLRLQDRRIRNIFTTMDMMITENNILRYVLRDLSYFQSIYFSPMFPSQKALNPHHIDG